MDDRFPGQAGHRYYGPHDQEYPTADTRGQQRYSSARDYAAAGEFGNDWRRGSGERDAYGQRGDYEGERYRDPYAERGGRRFDSRNQSYRGGRYDQDRGFIDRAGDEIRSWFGDEAAERRRERDARYDAQRYNDPHYGQWRRERIAELDRDYDEYARENADRFNREFTGWRTERQGQRDSLARVTEHMEVFGSDGEKIGTVDKVRGDRIILTKGDVEAGGHHHSIPSRWIETVDDKVTLRKSAIEAKTAWKDEERGAFFGSDAREDRGDRGGNGPHILNRSFSGTY